MSAEKKSQVKNLGTVLCEYDTIVAHNPINGMKRKLNLPVEFSSANAVTMEIQIVIACDQ